MKLLELTVEHLPGVPDGTYSFADADENLRGVVVLTGDQPAALLEIIASLLETVRVPGPAPHRLAWWRFRQGSAEARLSARWALTAGEAARAGLPVRTAASEWRFGPEDQLPREVVVQGALPLRARRDLARYVHVDASEIDVWLGADPLAELLGGIARRDIAATRVACQQGVGIVGYDTPDTFATLTKAIAPVLPAIRLERVSVAQGDAPVACLRDGERVELDELPDVERYAVYLAAAIHTGNVRGGVVLANGLDIPTPAEAHWLDWLSGVAATHQVQIIVAAEAQPTCAKVVELGADAVPEEHVQACTDCRENRQVAGAIRSMHSGATPRPGWQEEVLARIAKRELRYREGER